jgi:hypothetical protein
VAEFDVDGDRLNTIDFLGMHKNNTKGFNFNASSRMMLPIA